MAGKMNYYVILPALFFISNLEFFQMVYSYKRKTTRGSWNVADMERALEAVRNGEMGWLKASKHFNVPTATLRRRGLNKNKIATNATKHLGSLQSVLNGEVEAAIVNHILDLESRFFGLTTTDLRKIAYEVAEKKKIKHSFNKENKMAGKGWLRGFRQRNSELSLRIPEATSLARAEAFNKPQVEKFFTKLEQVVEEHKIHNTMVFNMDESALTTVQVPPKVFARKGKRQVGALTSAERGVHTTVVACFSSGGTYVPPAIIFPRKRFNPALYDGAPVGTLKLHNESGYMTGDLFQIWMRHFVEHARPNLENKALLILDGHSSHKSYEALEFAKKNFVILLCLPAHCTHRLQPLDVAFFGPLYKYYNQVVTQWLRENPGRTVSIYQVSKLFKQAYEKTATLENASSGFRSTGISPFNSNIFPEHMFLPSLTTDLPEDAPTAERKLPNVDDHYMQESANNDQDCPSTSEKTDIEVILKDLSPVPQSNKRKAVKRKTGGYQDVLTESPYLKSLLEKENEKKQEQQRKSNRNVVRKKLMKDELSGEEDPFSGSDEEDDCACIYCNDLFSRSKSKESWLRCQYCKKWAHSECAGVSPKSKNFICDLCKN